MGFRAAFGKLDVTPRLEMQGSFRLSHDGHAAGIHDPVYARCMVAEDGDVRWCLIALDVVMLQRPQAARWRERIGALAGVSPDHVTVSCTHTHSGPDLPNEWERYDKEWEADLVDRIGNAVAQAMAQLEPAKCGWAQAEYNGPINRHEVRLVKLHEGDEAAARAEAERLGPVDKALAVLRVDSAEGAPLGHVVHFNAHPTTAMGVDQLLSADYPGVLLRETESELGGVGIFLQGTCGNVNLEIGERAFRHAERHGRAMGRLAVEALQSADVQSPAEPLSVATTGLEAAVRHDFRAPEQVQPEIDELVAQWERFETEHPGERIPAPLWNRLRVRRIEANSRKFFEGVSSIPVPVQHVRLAGRSLLITPGEWFVEFGLRLKEEHADLRTIWVGYSNGQIGYVPTCKAWAEPGYMGNANHMISFLAQGEGERLYELMSRWLKFGAGNTRITA